MPVQFRPIDRDSVAEAAARSVSQTQDEGDAEIGLAVLTRDGDLIEAGSGRAAFPIQSISKVFALDLALEVLGDALWSRVGREPSGDPFNSIIDLERHRGHPRNPFINAGALVVVDALLDHCPDGDEPAAVVALVRDLLGGAPVELDEAVARSDADTAHLNRALAYLAKHFGNLTHPVDAVIEAYARQCAIRLDCAGLARAGRFLMLDGPDDAARRRGAAARRAGRIGALMTTCGQYDGSGDFAYRVGIPAKSGVSGGLLAVVPHVASIAVWSPGLDDNGNSRAGTRALERLVEALDWSVFGRVPPEGA